MNQAHLHLLINHLPITGLALGMFIMIAGHLLKNDPIKNTALGIFVLTAIGSFIAMQTGEGAEHLIKKLPGVDKKLIHEHEDTAEVLAWILYALGVLSILGIWAYIKKKSFYNFICILGLIISVGAAIDGYYVGISGGSIRHPEINSTTTPSQNESEKEGEEH